jgi:small subunit ribosomal protein S4
MPICWRKVGLTSRSPRLYGRGIPENVGRPPRLFAREREGVYRDNNKPKRNPKFMSSKRQEPKYKINRRLAVNLWGRPKSPLNRREYGPGQHGQRRKKPSDFGTQLAAKQKLKGYYANLGERQFRRLYEEAVRRRGDTGDNLIELLERRLDAVVYRMKLVPTPFSARQLVNHGHVRVNGRRVTIPSYSVRDGDEIELGGKAKAMALVLEASRSGERDVPDYVEIDHDRMKGRFIRAPKPTDVPYPVSMEPNLVIEFYSR